MVKNVITNNSSTVVSHFSKLIFLIAHFSFRGLQSATWTTAVAPDPVKQNIQITLTVHDHVDYKLIYPYNNN